MDPQLLTREAPDFKVFSGILKAYEADGRKKISGVTSSTVKDLHGDIMELSALQSMERSAKQNMTIWLNHEYEVPKDIFGSTLDARVVQRGSDVWDLDIDIAVNETNPRAMDTWAAINAGTKLGLSIGAMLKDYTLEKDGTFIIRDVELLEASVVSIPANPRSWVQYAVKAAKAKSTLPVGVIQNGTTSTLMGPWRTFDGVNFQYDPNFSTDVWDTAYINSLPDSAFAYIEDGGSKDDEGKTTPRSLRHFPHHAKGGSPDEAHVRNALSRIPQSSVTDAAKSKALAHVRRHAKAMGIGTDEQDDAEPEITNDGLDQTCEECGEPLDACKCNNGKPPNARRQNEATPDVEAQEAPSTESDPENADGDTVTASATDADASTDDAADGGAADGETTADAAVTETIGDVTTKSITELVALLRTTTSELVTTKAELLKARSERELAVKGFFSAIDIVERVADLPLSRKAQGSFGQASAEINRLRSVYSEQFLKMLESKNNG